VPRSRKSATARTSQQADTSTHASEARRNEVVRGLNQRPSRKRKARRLAARRGRATITAAAAPPPAPSSHVRTRSFGRSLSLCWRQDGSRTDEQSFDCAGLMDHFERAWVAECDLDAGKAPSNKLASEPYGLLDILRSGNRNDADPAEEIHDSQLSRERPRLTSLGRSASSSYRCSHVGAWKRAAILTDLLTD
jgi:hypothetical protein